ncbi:50S ribosomal protein L7/L12 [Candidatus Dojkabacteria bacterium CG_4_10_14_3_um_filter_Dojkabacteria_WS6_41_9]|nr:MAG: 50S ribosomal protein L7/L12 [Candidatus Dojkabacteria bacterium CG_4_10_14_3_um_filter_Dojkabacteria_WS6_41_9]
MAELNKKQQEVLDLVSEMSVLELADLVKAMEEKFGVSAAAPAAAAAPVAAAAAPTEEKSIFDVVLENAGSNKIGVIKVVKDLTGLGLTEAKDFVEAAPKTLKEGVAKAEADEIAAKLKEAGATVSVK